MEDTTFIGFDAPRANWSKLPHQFVEALPKISSLGEMKVILYVLRHTWGFGEFGEWEAKCITTDEFENGRKLRDGERMDGGTGLTRPTIYDGLNRAVEDGFLVRLIDNSDKGRITHYYRLRRPIDDCGTVYACDPSEPGLTPWHSIDPDVKKEVYQRFQGRCAYCENKSRRWHYDHIVPKSRGGPDDLDNLALACPTCNLSKNDRTPEEWGRPVILYDGDVKKIYQGWLKYFTAPSKESSHRTEKETKERNLETINAGASKKNLELDASLSGIVLEEIYYRDKEKVTTSGRVYDPPWYAHCPKCDTDIEVTVLDQPTECQCALGAVTLLSKKAQPPIMIPEALLIYQRLTNRKVPPAWQEEVVKTVGDDTAFWQEVIRAYIGLGWNAGNVANMLKYFSNEELPGERKPKEEVPESPPEVPEGYTYAAGKLWKIVEGPSTEDIAWAEEQRLKREQGI